jgi:DNA-binding response OmpR family regulator
VSAKPDLVLLDIMLPDGSGIDYCRELYDSTRTPVIMVTARSSEVDVVLGLEIGAADYVTKPFRLRELIARIRAVLRRPLANTDEEVVTFGDLRIDFVRRTVIRRGEEIELSRKEFDLLALFASRLGQVVTREVCLGHAHLGHARQTPSPEDRERPRQPSSPHHYSWSGIPARPLTLPSCKKVTSPPTSNSTTRTATSGRFRRCC